MIETQINLSEQNQQALIEISDLTGKSQQELITVAIEQMIESYQKQKQGREDIFDLDQLREEWNR